MEQNESETSAPTDQGVAVSAISKESLSTADGARRHAYIYLLQDGSYKNTRTYKIGKTVQKNGDTRSLNRLKAYSSGTIVYNVFNVGVDDVDGIERRIKQAFKEKYTLVKGSEWFSGCVVTMAEDIYSLIHSINAEAKAKAEADATVEDNAAVNDNEICELNIHTGGADKNERAICERCGNVFGRKQHLITHLKRAKVCHPTKSGVEREVLLGKLRFNAEKRVVPCSFCNKMFTLKANARVHEVSCKKKREEEASFTGNDTVQELTKQVQLIQTKLSELSNKTAVNTPSINPFGKETMDHIKKEDVIEYLKQYRYRFVDIFNLIYDWPENKNVRLLSIKNKLMEVYTGDKWDVRNSNEVTDAMIQKTNDLGCQVYHASDELQALDALEDNEYRIRKLMMRLGAKSNHDYYQIKGRVMAELCSKKKQLADKVVV
jgi:hypothetical protein